MSFEKIAQEAFPQGSSEAQNIAILSQDRSKDFEISSLEFQKLAQSVGKNLSAFIEDLAVCKAYTPAQGSELKMWREKLSELKEPEETIHHVISGLASQGILTAGPRHLGYIPGGGLPLGGLADWIAATINPFSGDSLASPVAAEIHGDCLKTLATWVGYDPEEAGGDLTSGGTHATLLALKIARDQKGIKARDYHRSVVYVGEHTHHCAQKALDVLFGEDLIVRVTPSNKREQMDTDALNQQIAADKSAGLRPFLVIGTAGSTNLGSVDNLEVLAKIAKNEDLWFHVDGAYGGFFVLCPELSPVFNGLGEADSIVLDPHKGLFLPYGLGAVLWKKAATRGTKEFVADYLQDRKKPLGKVLNDDQLPPSPMDHSLELTRPFRSLRLWLALKLYGKEMFAHALREKWALARYARHKLKERKGLEVLDAGDLSIVAFRVVSSGENQAGVDEQKTADLLSHILNTGEAFLTSTRVKGILVVRLAILSFRTHLNDLDQVIRLIDDATAHIAKTSSQYSNYNS